MAGIDKIYVHKYYEYNDLCGVNPKWEWFYRIFWKGKKYFMY